jgi:hypothetical protein
MHLHSVILQAGCSLDMFVHVGSLEGSGRRVTELKGRPARREGAKAPARKVQL